MSVLAKPKKEKPLPPILQVSKEFAIAAAERGCPDDQIKNFLKAGVLLQSKQLEMAAAARSCDYRCPACQEKYRTNSEIPMECPDCGPTAVGFGGARGGAKSHFMFAQITCDDPQRYAGLKILYLRKSATAAREQIRGLLRMVCHNQDGSKRIEYNYREQAGTIEFPNGSYIIIKHFKDEKDIENFIGQEYDVIAIEELTTLTFKKFEDLTTCLRSSKPNWRPRLYAAWNWGGIGHAWVMKVFYEPWAKKIERTTRYILALVTDNRFNNPEYINRLKILTGWKYKSWYLGDPHFQAGQFFKMWSDSIHVYPNEKIQGFESKMVSWSCSFDHGLDHPACCLLHARDANGIKYTVDEYHENEKVISENAENIKAMLRRHNLGLEHIDSFVAGNDCFRRSVDIDGTKTIASMYEECEIVMTPAKTDRINRWEIMGNLLGNPENGVAPTWYIHARCKNLIAQIPMAQSHETRMGDIQKMNAVDGEGGDDALEAASFELASDGDISMKFATPISLTGFQPAMLAMP
jgi:phage terminase large subunit